jgi:hypothetical protein
MMSQIRVRVVQDELHNGSFCPMTNFSSLIKNDKQIKKSGDGGIERKRQRQSEIMLRPCGPRHSLLAPCLFCSGTCSSPRTKRHIKENSYGMPARRENINVTCTYAWQQVCLQGPNTSPVPEQQLARVGLRHSVNCLKGFRGSMSCRTKITSDWLREQQEREIGKRKEEERVHKRNHNIVQRRG